MNKKYDNPPIVEALIAFTFHAENDWDLTIPGLFFDKVKDAFPVRQQHVGFGTEFQPGKEILTQNISIIERVQFYNNDRNALVQIGRNVLSVHHLKPYHGWENFKPLILSNFQNYLNVANPKMLQRIELRYINKIDFGEIVKMEDYFTTYPMVPAGLPDLHGGFQVFIEIPFNEQKNVVLFTLKSAPPTKQDYISIVVDLKQVSIDMENLKAMDIGEVEKWIDRAHDNIEQVFEASITDNLRAVFEKDQ